METCHICGNETNEGARYNDKPTCYSCCGDLDREWMRTHDRITLYLTHRNKWEVTNWPGTMRYNAAVRVNPHGHNWGLTRRDAWFTDYDGQSWWGVSYGDMTELVHCRKLKH